VLKETQLVKHIMCPLEYAQGLKSHMIQMIEFYPYCMHAIHISMNMKVSIEMGAGAY